MPTRNNRTDRADVRELRSALETTLKSIRELLAEFKPERICFLTISFASGLLLLYAAFRLIRNGGQEADVLGTIFGSSGLAAGCALTVVYFFRRSFGLIERIIETLLRMAPVQTDATREAE